MCSETAKYFSFQLSNFQNHGEKKRINPLCKENIFYLYVNIEEKRFLSAVHKLMVFFEN